MTLSSCIKREEAKISGCESINLGTRLSSVKLDEKQTYPRDIWKVLLVIREVILTYIFKEKKFLNKCDFKTIFPYNPQR